MVSAAGSEPALTGYALPNAWELARSRLELFEACHNPASIRRAEALGLRAGMRCLEAGAGAGSFARWLHSKTGSVVAADIDVRLLEGFDELDVRRIDLVADELPRDAFDFVHTRCVLIHIPERDEVLRKLAASLRPGGVLMIEEDDEHPVFALASGGYREAWLAFVRFMRAAGVDPQWARGLPERLGALGLTGVGAEIDGQIFAGGSDAARFWSLTWLQVVPEATAAGRAELEDERRWFHGPAKVVAWGRRPAD